MRRLKRDGPALFKRAQIPAAGRDGYRSSTRGGGGGNAGLYSDPVSDVAVSNVELQEEAAAKAAAEGRQVEQRSDHLCAAVDRMVTHAMFSLRAARLADAARAEALPPEPLPAEAPGCIICWRFEVVSPVHKAGRCRACYEYRLRHSNEDCPEQVILRRDELRARRPSRTVWRAA